MTVAAASSVAGNSSYLEPLQQGLGVSVAEDRRRLLQERNRLEQEVCGKARLQSLAAGEEPEIWVAQQRLQGLAGLQKACSKDLRVNPDCRS